MRSPSQVAAIGAVLLVGVSFARGAIVPSFGLRPLTGSAYGPFEFDASATMDTTPGRAIVAYRWDFDDTDGFDFNSPDAIGVIVQANLEPRPTITAGGPYTYVRSSGVNLVLAATQVASRWDFRMQATNDLGETAVASRVIQYVDAFRLWDWDLDNDGVDDFRVFENPTLTLTPAQVDQFFPINGVHTIRVDVIGRQEGGSGVAQVTVVPEPAGLAFAASALPLAALLLRPRR